MRRHVLPRLCNRRCVAGARRCSGLRRLSHGRRAGDTARAHFGGRRGCESAPDPGSTTCGHPKAGH